MYTNNNIKFQHIKFYSINMSYSTKNINKEIFVNLFYNNRITNNRDNERDQKVLQDHYQISWTCNEEKGQVSTPIKKNIYIKMKYFQHTGNNIHRTLMILSSLKSINFILTKSTHIRVTRMSFLTIFSLSNLQWKIPHLVTNLLTTKEHICKG